MSIQEESKQIVQHSDDACPNMDQVKKLKGEIKRLRQELILKGTGKKKDEDDYLSDDSGLDEEEKAALRMLSPE